MNAITERDRNLAEARAYPPGTLDGSTARDEIHKASPGPDRKVRRSRFFPGLAAAMAMQWAGPAETSIKGESA